MEARIGVLPKHRVHPVRPALSELPGWGACDFEPRREVSGPLQAEDLASGTRRRR
jgi:hypothetical protein